LLFEESLSFLSVEFFFSTSVIAIFVHAGGSGGGGGCGGVRMRAPIKLLLETIWEISMGSEKRADMVLELVEHHAVALVLFEDGH
jgi:hypothetical protein